MARCGSARVLLPGSSVVVLPGSSVVVFGTLRWYLRPSGAASRWQEFFCQRTACIGRPRHADDRTQRPVQT